MMIDKNRYKAALIKIIKANGNCIEVCCSDCGSICNKWEYRESDDNVYKEAVELFLLYFNKEDLVEALI